MSAPETILVGSLPPPLTGQTIAFQIACEGFEERGLPCRVIDLSGGGHTKPEGGFSLSRSMQLLKPFRRAFILLFGSKVLYLSATQNWAGFLRDAVFILLASFGRQRTVIHLQGGNYDGFHDSLGPLRKYAVRAVLSRVDRILVLGKSLYGMFDFDPSLQQKLHVVFNGLPYPETETAQVPKRLPTRDQDRPRLLYLSNLIVSKGYLQVLDALRILVHQRGIDAECHFCGSFVLSSDIRPYSTPGEAESDFLDRIEKSGLTRHAFWHGPVDGDEKLRFLRDSHFFLLPTCYAYEAQPISIIEALAFGLVVVATPHRTIPEMMAGSAGESVQFGRPDEIADAVESHVINPGKFEAGSRASIARYRGSFTREQHLDRLVPLILDSG